MSRSTKSIKKQKTTSLPVVAAASLSGTAVEWYDFFLYGSAAALVFPEVFFPSADPLVGTLSSFSTYAVGFLARPIGGAVLGNLGDKRGRKISLVLTLILMGVATFAIGLIPSYAAIGIASPILLVLLRLVQGFALGGEWGGAVLFASEHSTRSKRAFWASWPSMGPVLGNLIASGVLAILTATLTEGHFFSWGWRIAFFLSVVLVLIGIGLRGAVAETPVFESAQKRPPEHVRSPFVEVFRHHWKKIVIASLARFGDNSSFYIFSVFILTYTKTTDSLDSSTTLRAITLGMALCCVSIPLTGIVADFIGRRGIAIACCIGTIVVPFIYFPLVNAGTFGLMVMAAAMGLLLHGIFDAVLAPMYSEMFPTEVRMSGMSIAYNIATIFAGSLAPIIATLLFSHFQSATPIAIYIAIMGAVSLVAMLFVRESKGIDLNTVR